MESVETLTRETLKDALRGMTLSASGWRALFNIEKREESECEVLSDSYSVLTFLVVITFSEFFKKKYPKIKTVILARDSRPTGTNIENMVFCLLKETEPSFKIKNIGISPIPEVISYAKKMKAAFFYISASHNPIGYNGFKFGLGEEGVFASDKASILIEIFKKKIETCDISLIMKTCKKTKKENVTNIESKLEKSRAVKTYFKSAMKVISSCSSTKQARRFFENAKRVLEKEGRTIYMVCDFNGSARATSIDERILKKIGIIFIPLNKEKIIHDIIPEGENLTTLSVKLEALYKEKKGLGIFFGFAPDCDGDRGNIVYIDDNGKPKILSSQNIFSLSVISEILHMKSLQKSKNLAVVANGPTSLMLEEISKRYHFDVFRSEVGEANVVNLGKELSKRGYHVRILGEGSNGGAIISPSLVRDPINTIFSILKFFFLTGRGFTSFSSIVDILPKYSTTSVADKRAIMKVKINDVKKFRKAFQEVFTSQWQLKKETLKNLYGFYSFRAFTYIGSKTIEVSEDFAATEKGGFKIIFYDDQEIGQAFIWMRKSGTEPVFRVMVDVKNGNDDMEMALLQWEREMIEKSL